MSVRFTGSHPFINCCGSTIIWGFSNYPDSKRDLLFPAPPTAQIQAFAPGHIYCAIMNQAQYTAWGDIMIKNNFRVVSDQTVNANSKNRLYFLLRDPETPKIEPQKSLATRMFGS